jgi:hypothetical protein
MDQEIIQKIIKWLTPAGIDLFRRYKNSFGIVNPVLNEYQARVFFNIPVGRSSRSHSVHDKEGKKVRQFLRMQQECKSWSKEDFNIKWIDVIEDVLNSVESKN